MKQRNRRRSQLLGGHAPRAAFALGYALLLALVLPLITAGKLVPSASADALLAHGVSSAGDVSTTSGVDAQSLVQALFTWLALLFMTFWVGGLIWETWILAPSMARDPDTAEAARAAARRFRRLASSALCLVLIMDVGIVLAQAAGMAGEWSGAVSPPLLRAILFGSRYGDFWWMRQLTVLAALALLYLAKRRGWQPHRTLPVRSGDATADASMVPAEISAVPDWRRELLAALRGVPYLPRRLAYGWSARSPLGRAELFLGALLMLAFALSSHAAAVPARDFAFALSVDLFHLACEAAWVGGLFYISVVFLPALAALAERGHARALALGLPKFSAVAICCAVALAATGSLDTTVHLTSIQQFLTTAYGRILAVKIEFFLFMAAISAYHTFNLLPRLARALAEPHEAPFETLAQVALAGSRTPVASARGWREQGDTSDHGAHGPLAGTARRLAERLEDWLEREAVIGAIILLCVALLGAYAGSFATAPAASASSAPAATPFEQAVTVQGYAISLKVTPDRFGTNTFDVTVKDGNGQPVDGASVVVTTNMLDMDMGTQRLQLLPLGSGSPGTYSGKADLTMAGHWALTVKIVLPNTTRPITTQFTFTATY